MRNDTIYGRWCRHNQCGKGNDSIEDAGIRVTLLNDIGSSLVIKVTGVIQLVNATRAGAFVVVTVEPIQLMHQPQQKV